MALKNGQMDEKNTMTKPKKISLSYDDLLARVSEVKRLAETNLLDDATRARMAHLVRFFERLRKSVPEELQNLQVKDVYAEDDEMLDKLWRETAEGDTEIGPRPSMQ